jgi:hypothetical protein
MRFAPIKRRTSRPDGPGARDARPPAAEGGVPTTYVQPPARASARRSVDEPRRDFCKHVTVVGPTKSGKTVLAGKVLPRDTSPTPSLRSTCDGGLGHASSGQLV